MNPTAGLQVYQGALLIPGVNLGDCRTPGLIHQEMVMQSLP